MRAPLDGLKVIELARILAGPWAGQTLADLGAEVIKVESPAGDDTRQWGPPFIEREGDRSAAYFHSTNRGKASVTVDFRTPEGQVRVRDMIRDADIVIENFKVGGLAKYGLDYDSLSAINPGLIYCSITGFGQDGPYAHRAGYDYIIQGMSGLMSITGHPDGQPTKVGVAVTDVFTGVYATTAILAALHQRGVTGKGQHIDMALLDVAVSVTANQAMNYLSTGTAPGRLGNFHPNLSPYQVFDCADGFIIIAVGNDAQFTRLCALLGCPDLALDPDQVGLQTGYDRGQPVVEGRVCTVAPVQIFGQLRQQPIIGNSRLFLPGACGLEQLQLRLDTCPGLRVGRDTIAHLLELPFKPFQRFCRHKTCR